ncbi:hypothetical protein ACVBEQ_18160 [Nakamurella sp. GG22]
MTSTAAVPPDILAAIVADAAGQVPTRSVELAPEGEVAAGEVEVLSAESVRWNDGSLGCPEPGRSYTQALVDGYRVIVRVGDVELDYRVNGRGRFRICRRGGGRSARSFR